MIMDIESFSRQDKIQQLREELLVIEEDRMAGRMGCALSELDNYLDDVIAEV